MIEGGNAGNGCCTVVVFLMLQVEICSPHISKVFFKSNKLHNP